MVALEDLFSGVYKGKIVLVTGHTGFKGAWLALWLHLLGARVIGFASAPPTIPSLFDLIGLGNLITHVSGDVRDQKQVVEVFRVHQPDIVFHLAAQSLVRYSYDDPVETYATNVMGTVNLLEAIRVTPRVRVCVNVTSDKCYENREWEYAYREIDSLGGCDPYSSSKGCAELVTAAYRKSFFEKCKNRIVGVSSARAGNVIGGGDWASDRLIPDCVRALSGGGDLQLRNPDSVRPWQYVLDPLAGYLWLGACLFNSPGKFEGSWNFGPDGMSTIPVRDVVRQVLTCWGGESESLKIEIQMSDDKRHEAHILRLDTTKARTRLKWHPLFELSEAIAETMAWYMRQHRDHRASLRETTISCIIRYVEKAMEKKAVWIGNA